MEYNHNKENESVINSLIHNKNMNFNLLALILCFRKNNGTFRFWFYGGFLD